MLCPRSLLDDGILYPADQFERMAVAPKTGNHQRLVSWKAWILPSVTEFQNLQFGEGWREDGVPSVTDHGIWTSGPQEGLQAHSMFMVDDPDCGIWKPDTRIRTLITPEEAVNRISLSKQCGQVVTMNIQMYEDGSVSPESLQVMQAVRAAFRKE